MPGTYLPITTFYPQGCVSINSLSNVSYSEILNSLNNSNFKVLNLYFKTNSIDQISTALQFVKYDSSGNISKENLQVAIDPYQQQLSINCDLKNKDYVFNGQFYFNLLLLANQSCIFVFEVEELSMKTLLKSYSLFHNFKNKIDE